MDRECAAVCDGQRCRRYRLDAEIVNARGDGALDLRAQQLLEHAEQEVLQVDRERQQAVEEGGDRRQLLAQAAIAVRQLEAGGVLERLQGTAVDLAGIEQDVELAQRGAAIGGRSAEHTSELQSLMRISYAVFCLKKKK